MSTMPTKELTDADKRALAEMPDGWFRPDSLPYTIRSPHFRCRRLYLAGLLERDLGSSRSVDLRYRKQTT